MIYMKSLNTSDGRMLLDVSFQVEMDRDMANVLTQNRVSQAQSRLPQEVTQQGVTVKKINPSILNVISLYSPNGTYDAQFLNNYAMINVRDAILRVQGVAQVDLYGGAEYAMRIWLRPDRLATLGITAADVISAIKEQNLQAPAGKVGDEPAPPGQEFTYTVRAPGRSGHARRNSTTSSCVRRRAAGSRGSKTSGAPIWEARTTARSEDSTESLPAFWRCTCSPGPIRSSPPRASTTRWTS